MPTYSANCMCRVISVEAEEEPAAVGFVIASLSRLVGQPGEWRGNLATRQDDDRKRGRPDWQLCQFKRSPASLVQKCGRHVFYDVGPFGVVDVYASLVQGLCSSRRFISTTKVQSCR